MLECHARTGEDMDIDVRGQDAATALYLSTRRPDISVIRSLLESGTNPNTKYVGNWSPLHYVACSQDRSGCELQAAEALIDHGAELDPKTEPGRFTPLLQACFRGNYDIAEMLIRRGANTNATSASGFGVFAVVQLYPVELVRLLLRAGTDINQENAGWTPLQTAVFGDRDDLVAELLRHGANVNGGQPYRTPLSVASQRHNDDITRALLDAGANPHIDSNPPTTDWNFIALAALRWRREAEAALDSERADHSATLNSFTFALPHLLASAARR